MTIAERAVHEARLWIGTPYVHQASLRAVGADCLGLVRGVWRRLYGREPCAVPPYDADWAEASGGETLLMATATWLWPKRRSSASVGDVLVFRMREGGVAKHLGIQSAVGDVPRFIHAYSGHSVMESALSKPWARRIAARFAFPEGEN